MQDIVMKVLWNDNYAADFGSLMACLQAMQQFQILTNMLRKPDISF